MVLVMKKKDEYDKNLESNRPNLKEILGDIKSVVSEEKEALLKEKIGEKTIKLTEKELLSPKQKFANRQDEAFVKKSEIFALVKELVRKEIKIQYTATMKRTKKSKVTTLPSKDMERDLNQMTKLQLEELGRKQGVELDRRKSKASLVQELKSLEANK
jgi:hypothetical protein